MFAERGCDSEKDDLKAVRDKQTTTATCLPQYFCMTPSTVSPCRELLIYKSTDDEETKKNEYKFNLVMRSE